MRTTSRQIVVVSISRQRVHFEIYAPTLYFDLVGLFRSALKSVNIASFLVLAFDFNVAYNIVIEMLDFLSGFKFQDDLTSMDLCVCYKKH